MKNFVVFTRIFWIYLNFLDFSDSVKIIIQRIFSQVSIKKIMIYLLLECVLKLLST